MIIKRVRVAVSNSEEFCRQEDVSALPLSRYDLHLHHSYFFMQIMQQLTTTVLTQF